MTEEHNIPKVYDPASVEKKWYEFWGKEQIFSCRAGTGPKSRSAL